MTEPSPVHRRTLILLRHAKAERGEEIADFDRALTTRGRADSGAAGRWLTEHGIQPDQVLCSPARRTRQTWEAVAGAVGENGGEPIVRYEPDLYHGTARDLLGLVREVAPEIRTLLVIGHNPTVSEVSDLLDPAPAEAEWMRTCELAVHHLPASWADIRPGAVPLDRRHTARAG